MIILSQVACTWKDVKKLKHEIEKKSSSTSVLFRCKLLQAADTLQVGAGLCLQRFVHHFIKLLSASLSKVQFGAWCFLAFVRTHLNLVFL